jgi:hypothetical protein
LYAQGKEDYGSWFHYMFEDLEEGTKKKIERKDEHIKSYGAREWKLDPEGKDSVLILGNNGVIGAYGTLRLDITTEKVTLLSHLVYGPETIAEFYGINDSATEHTVAIRNAEETKVRTMSYTFKISEGKNSKEDLFASPSVTYKADTKLRYEGNNLVSLSTNDINQVFVKVQGQVEADKTVSALDKIDTNKIKTFGLADNKFVVAIHDYSVKGFDVLFIPIKQENPSRKYYVKEISKINFFYPVITIVKGCNEIILYDVSEELYYYMKLGAPIALESSTLTTSYSAELKVFQDYGDYLGFSTYSFTLGTGAYFSSTYYMKYLEKSTFPDSPLLAAFEAMKTKFVSNDEDAYILQFGNAIQAIGVLTYGLTQVSESTFKKGEVLHINYESFFTWRKNGKKVMRKTSPTNFSDTSAGESIYESQDYLKSVTMEYNPITYQNNFIIADEIKYLKIFKFYTDNDKKKFEMVNEYHVNDDFDGSTRF